MPYYGMTDPAEFYQGSNFDPLTGRLQGGQMIAQLLNQIAGNKRKKKEEEWELEDREMGKRYKEAQISNLYETPQKAEPKPTSKVSPQMVKSMMKRLEYPDEAILEVDTMNEPALAAAWAKTQDDFSRRKLQGMRVPKVVATPKGKQQAAALKSALDVVQRRLNPITGALTQLYSNSENAMLSQERIAWLEKEQAKLNEQVGTIASMLSNIDDETGELTDSQFAQLNTILKYQSVWRPYIPKSGSDNIIDTKTIDGQTLYKWESDKQWHPNKPTQTKK